MKHQDFKVKVFKLNTVSSMFQANYSKEIEDTVNNNTTMEEPYKDYFLTDFKLLEIEGKPYVVLRYERSI